LLLGGGKALPPLAPLVAGLAAANAIYLQAIAHCYVREAGASIKHFTFKHEYLGDNVRNHCYLLLIIDIWPP